MSNEKDTTIKIKRLSSDPNYFNNVFKKTEKLVSVTLYILSHINIKDTESFHIVQIKDKALSVHEASLRTLSLQIHNAEEDLFDFQYQLLGFDSVLRIAEASQVIPADIAALLLDQVDGIQRYINNHFQSNSGLSLEPSVPAKKQTGKSLSSAPRRQTKVQIPAGDISTDAYLVYSQLTDRAERIKTVLEAKPQATIKDIAEVITDVSEKTIQRELNSLIEKGQVIREGERRWSRYSISK